MVNTNKDKYTQISDIIMNSWHTFHVEVVSFLKDNWWNTLISPYYNDSRTNKAREIDIIAQKDFVFTIFEWTYKIRVELFVECKYNKNLTLFWFDDINYESAISLITNMNKIEKTNTYHDKSHYISSDKKVAKLYASSKDKDIENEPFFKWINQVLNWFLYYRNDYKYGIFDEPDIIMKLPIIICNNFDNVFRIDIWSKQAASKIILPFFSIEVDYNYIAHDNTPKNEYFLIDIIDFKNFNMFIKSLNDMEFKSILTVKP